MSRPAPARRSPGLSATQAWVLVVVIVVVLVAGGVATLVGTGGGGSGSPPLVTSPQTISPDIGAGAQCPAGAANGHCIVPGGPSRP